MSYQANLSIILQNRKACKKLLDSLSLAQINQIPAGFNNNILWNCAHIIAVLQRLTYGLASLDYSVPTEFVTRFSPGTKPDEGYDDTFVKEIQSLLFTTFEQFVIDIDQNKFNDFRPFMTALKFEINDLQTAIAFNQYHEALHMGHILNIRKFL